MYRIGLDLDGVVYNFMDELKIALFGSTKVSDPVCWEAWKDWNISKERFDRSMLFAVKYKKLFSAGKPYDGALNFIRNMRMNGHTIHFITDRARWPEALTQTAHWLEEHKVEHDSLTFTKKKHLVETDFYVDDKPENCRDVAMHVPDTKVFLMDRPWNEGHNADYYTRINDLKELEGKIN